MNDEKWWSDESFDSLEADVLRAQGDEELSSELRTQEVRRHTQANDLREKFFRVACCLAIGTVLASIMLVVAAVFGREIDRVVAVGFITGLAVETVGILLVMAGYLFPRDTVKI